jgi:23S rRNA (adenine2503-C2)-methyltransferase
MQDKSLHLTHRYLSKDGVSTKYVWDVENGSSIETVFIRFKDYDSICVSSQAGCALKCAFCATGLGGFQRNLSDIEIIEQVYNILEDIDFLPRNPKISFMGMGEPLLNLKNVLEAHRLLLSKYPLMRFSLSTVGIVPKIYELAKQDSNIQLQVSLHASNDELRKEIIPITNKYPIKEILEAAKNYAISTNSIVRINYLLFEGVNDSISHAEELVDLLIDMPVYLKVSKYNPVLGVVLETPSDKKHTAFEDKCQKMGIKVYSFFSRGVDIEGGCGQLRLKQ